MDIIVTTPKGEMENARREAEDVKRAGGGFYFRRFGVRPPVDKGDRVYYVEDGYIRGFATVFNVERRNGSETCETTGRRWAPGWYVYMSADSWRWIRPIPMKGFQNWRYARAFVFTHEERRCKGYNPGAPEALVIGGWLDPKPEVWGQ